MPRKLKPSRMLRATLWLVLIANLVYIGFAYLKITEVNPDPPTNRETVVTSELAESLFQQTAEKISHLKVAEMTPLHNSPISRSEPVYPFYVVEKKWDSRTNSTGFFRVGMNGDECSNPQNVRRYILSENQAKYPTPESACGPIALLNLYVWYSKFGLIKETVRHSDPEKYKQLKFLEIDQMITKARGSSRSLNAGTSHLEQVVAMDTLLNDNSEGDIRLHSVSKNPPLSNRDFTEISIRYRAGILAVQPLDLRTGQLMDGHAVLVIRGDLSGKITVANWGEFIHCSLVNKPDGQWLMPSNPEQNPLKIQLLTSLIPFRPTSKH